MSRMHQKALLIIFVKNPEPGKVKTRLAKTAGQEKALAIYRKLLTYTREITKPLDTDRQVWYSHYVDDGDEWDPGNYIKKVQQGKDLGERMKHAFEEAFGEGYKKVVIIGSDCAELSSGIIQRAFNSLGAQDIVVGPSADGGYYLLGMKAFHPGLFENIQWSTPAVLSQTLRKIGQERRSLYLLPELNDVDDENDWEEVKEQF